MIKDQNIDLSKKMINQAVYSIHPGRKIHSLDVPLSVDDDFLILSIENLALFTPYLGMNKRMYVLLDKNIQKQHYSKYERDNVWFIPTNLRLPNLILCSDAIYHVNFALKTDIINNVRDIFLFYKYLIQRFANNILPIHVDVFEPEFSSVEALPNLGAVNRKYIFISDVYEAEKLIRSKPGNRITNKTYFLLDSTTINPLDLLADNLLQCCVIAEDRVYILKTDFDFSIDQVHFQLVVNNISYQEAHSNKYYFLADDKEVIIEKEVIIPVKIPIDYLRENDESYQNNKLQSFIDGITIDPLALALRIKPSVVFLKLSDFKNVKPLSTETIDKDYADLKDSKVELYSTSQGLVAFGDKSILPLIKKTKIAYVIPK